MVVTVAIHAHVVLVVIEVVGGRLILWWLLHKGARAISARKRTHTSAYWLHELLLFRRPWWLPVDNFKHVVRRLLEVALLALQQCCQELSVKLAHNALVLGFCEKRSSVTCWPNSSTSLSTLNASSAILTSSVCVASVENAQRVCCACPAGKPPTFVRLGKSPQRLHLSICTCSVWPVDRQHCVCLFSSCFRRGGRGRWLRACGLPFQGCLSLKKKNALQVLNAAPFWGCGLFVFLLRMARTFFYANTHNAPKPENRRRQRTTMATFALNDEELTKDPESLFSLVEKLGSGYAHPTKENLPI